MTALSRDSIQQWQLECLEQIPQLLSLSLEEQQEQQERAWHCIQTVTQLLDQGAFQTDNALHHTYLLLLCAYGTLTPAAADAAAQLLYRRLGVGPPAPPSPAPTTAPWDTAALLRVQPTSVARVAQLLERVVVAWIVLDCCRNSSEDGHRRRAAAWLWYWLLRLEQSQRHSHARSTEPDEETQAAVLQRLRSGVS